MYKAEGTIKYSGNSPSGYRLTIETDPKIAYYYRALIPKYYYVKGQFYTAHISVVRWEKPPILEKWGIHAGRVVEFSYDGTIEHDAKYWWLPVHCNVIGDLREELGLPRFVPWRNGYHLTIGNTKEEVNGQEQAEISGNVKRSAVGKSTCRS